MDPADLEVRKKIVTRAIETELPNVPAKSMLEGGECNPALPYREGTIDRLVDPNGMEQEVTAEPHRTLPSTPRSP